MPSLRETTLWGEVFNILADYVSGQETAGELTDEVVELMAPEPDVNQELLDATVRLIDGAIDEYGLVNPASGGMFVGIGRDGSLQLKGSFIERIERARELINRLEK